MADDFDIREERYMSSKEKDFENALRPLRFGDFSGQTKVVENLNIFVSTTRCCTVLPDWARRRWRISLRMSWAWGSR